ncbi:MAG: P1 family peptidase [Chloroflexi bacterium]|nr:P1 family peptidase [Chloroflexota bacterium]
MWNAITDVAGIRVGHWTDAKALTGCTAVLCERGAVAGVDVRGAAPGTRETDLMRPGTLIERVQGILLTGGSAFGLDAAGGVMAWLEERGAGFKIGTWSVPLVGAAVIFDLALGDGSVRPGAKQGYAAAKGAKDGPVAEGNVGAGAGATVAKMLGPAALVKGGLGTASKRLGDGTVIGAIVVVNAGGEIVDPKSGKTVAGPRKAKSKGFESTMALLQAKRSAPPPGGNTTIGVIATDAQLTKEQANKVAQMAQNGLAMAVRPAHTMFDGDTIFVMATGERKQRTNRSDVTVIGATAAEVTAEAIVRAVKAAKSVPGAPAIRDL